LYSLARNAFLYFLAFVDVGAATVVGSFFLSFWKAPQKISPVLNKYNRPEGSTPQRNPILDE